MNLLSIDSDMNWWEITFRVGYSYQYEYLLPSIYIRAKKVEKLSSHVLFIDGHTLFYDHDIVSIEKRYNFNTLISTLETLFVGHINDSNLWQTFMRWFPGVICDETVNTPEVVGRQVFRFIYNENLYEYDPHIKHFIRWSVIEERGVVNYESK